MKTNEAPEKYKTCDWLRNYEFIGLTKEHIKRLNNAINILESLNEHTDVKYLKEIKDKLLEVKEVKEMDLEKENIIGTFEREVKIDAAGYPYIDCDIEFYDYDMNMPLAKKGDKVKIVVVKGD